MLKSDKPPSGQDEGLDRKILTTLVNRYSQVNNARLQRIIEILNYHQQVFFESLPLLLHVNHPMLPGYISAFVPAGIQSFSPDKKQLSATKILANSFIYQPYGMDHFYPLLNITLMGSAGTIAHSYGSDMDIWVCHHPELTQNALEHLQQKLTAIEKYGEKLGLEVHFFMMNLEEFKRGERKTVSGEDCGSTQHYLLLDEFYRTSIHIAGCYPIWWLIPPSEEKNYDALTDKLFKKRYVKPEEFIDFGGIPSIPPGEFIGAGMWQLYKGIESPFKSVIKIMLTELYASEHPNVKPLCVNFKEAIFKGVTELDQLDPYILMYKRLDQYLQKNNEPNRLELIRQCFYLKINEPLSKNPSKNNLWKREALTKVVQNWEWSIDQFKRLDTRKTWKVDKVIEARTALVNELNNSYRFLSRFAKEHMSSATISQDDMNLLGRKLYAAFERKAGKVEFINPGIAPDIPEEELILLIESSNEDLTISRVFSLYLGHNKEEDLEDALVLKRGESYIEIIAWCFFNAIITAYSRFARIEKGKKIDLSEQESHKIIATFFHAFPEGLPHAEQDNFKYKARQEHNLYFINTGVDPFKKWNEMGIQRLSEQTDALSYSATHMNLVRRIDQVSINSWHEVLNSSFRDDDAVIELIIEYLRNNPRTGKYTKPPKNNFFCFGNTRGQDIAQRLEKLFESINKVFFEPKLKDDIQYIFELDTRYVIIQLISGQPRAKEANNLVQLIRELGQIKKQYTQLRFGDNALISHPLSKMAPKLKANTLQIFYQEKQDQRVEIFLFDQMNSLFFLISTLSEFKNCLSHMNAFVSRILSRRQIEEARIPAKEIKIELVKIIKSNADNEIFIFEKKNIEEFKESKNTYNISVTVEEKSDGEQSYCFYCNQKEFSEFEFGDKVFDAVCSHIMALRKTKENYPIYITDIDLSKIIKNKQDHQMCHFLQTKYALEIKVNQLINKSTQV